MAFSLLLWGVTWVACGDSGPAEWQSADGVRWRELADPGAGPAGFTAMDPGRTGISFANDFSEATLLENDIIANGSGVALGDFDGDGLVDVYLPSVEGISTLYRNLGGWRFEDVTAAAGVGLEGSVSRGAVWADLDGDGDLDLIVTRHSETNVLFRNDGGGAFTDISAETGFEAALASHSLALADTDRDGDLDLYVTNYKDRWARDTFAPADRQYDQVIGHEGDRYFIRPGYEDYFRVMLTDQGWQRWEFAEPDEFYRNDGGRLRRVPFTDPMFTDEDGRPLEREPDEWGLAVRFVDLDLDGDVDLYVCNDINSPDHIWMNDGAGNFRRIDPLAIRKTSAASMAVDVSDVDRDGWPDVFVAEMLSPDPVQRLTQVPEVDPNPPEPGEVETRPQVKRNTLQMNRGDGTFAETAFQAGVAASGWTWGALFLDVDLDGFEDLLSTNGNVLDWLDGDAQDRTLGVTGASDWRRLRLQFPPLPMSNVAFRNRGDGTFEDASTAWGYDLGPDISQGLAAGDLDGDGDLDVVINRLDQGALVLRNDAPAARVLARLRGWGANTRGIGARVRFEVAGLPAQEKEVAAGGLYLSDSDDAVVFAAADGTQGTLTVIWPDGSRREVGGIIAGREYEIEWGGASTGDSSGVAPADPALALVDPALALADAASPAADPTSAAATPASAARGTSPGPLFEDLTSVLGHTHHDAFFNEFTRQPLLPMRLAQLGPGVSWIDDDRDGDPDLWVGAGRGGRIARFENRGGVLRASRVGPPARGDITTLLPAPPGSPGRVLAGMMNYEAADPSVGISLPSVLALDLDRTVPAVGGAPSTTGPMALADYDGDGDLDLFVGGRVVPTAYPINAQGRFFRLENGAWTPDDANDGAIAGGGLISAAVFSDLDGDGDPDLVLATDWGPIRVFENRGGQFREATEAWGLLETTGRWNGIASGDLNEDGRPDLVVTAWGSNTEAALTGGRQEILHGDVDRNGVYDVIEVEVRPNGARAPVRRFDQLARGLPFLRRAIPDHHAYAAADLSSLIPGGGLQAGERLEASELRHLLLLSRAGNGFELMPLPVEAQRAPAFGVVVADLDGDGHQDVFLAQNFFATRLETPRYDAGRGILLRGDGTGTLTPVPGQVSGIAIYGEGRGAAVADFDGDRRLDLVVGQNARETRLFRNVGGSPGLRVHLLGPPGNPDAVGAAVRVEYESGAGPLVEIRSGSGYWSHDDPVQVLGLARRPVAVRVRWPGGAESRVKVPEGATEVRVAQPGESEGTPARPRE